MDQQHYVGLDVSLETTSICVVNQTGAIIWRGKCSTEPESISQTVRAHAPAAVHVGLETGQMSNWLTLQLRKHGVPVVCLDARHAKGALSMQLNKTDANDAHGLAQVVRTGWFREVAIKSMDAQALRMSLMARAQLVSQRQAVANNIRGLLKTFGFVIARGSKGPFSVRVREVIADNATLALIIESLLLAWQALREQVAALDQQVNLRAKSDAAPRRLMTVPGVGVIVALAYTAVIDNPNRFKRGTPVGAYLGLTPRRYQSGEVDKAGSISKCGDGLLRSYLFEAANVLLSRHPRSCKLKTWGLALAKRIGTPAPRWPWPASSPSSCTASGKKIATSTGATLRRQPHNRIRPTCGPTEFRLIRAGACPSRDEARQPRVLRCGSLGMTAFGT